MKVVEVPSSRYDQNPIWRVRGFHVIPTTLATHCQFGVTVAYMATGIAEQAYAQFCMLPQAYGAFLLTRTQPNLFVARNWHLICMPVKKHWNLKPEMSLIEKGVKQLAALPTNIAPVVLPALWNELDESQESNLKLILKRYLQDARFILALPGRLQTETITNRYRFEPRQPAKHTSKNRLTKKTSLKAKKSNPQEITPVLQNTTTQPQPTTLETSQQHTEKNTSIDSITDTNGTYRRAREPFAAIELLTLFPLPGRRAVRWELIPQ